MQNFFSDLFKKNTAPRIGCGDVAIDSCIGCDGDCLTTCVEYCSENCSEHSVSDLCAGCNGTCHGTCVLSCKSFCGALLLLK